jgi:hypothetical protein
VQRYIFFRKKTKNNKLKNIYLKKSMANTINIDANGGTYTANVNFSPSSCGSGSVTFTPQQNWIHVNGYTFTIEKNTRGQRTGYINMSYNGTECLQHKITVEQEGISCTCDNFIILEKYPAE